MRTLNVNLQCNSYNIYIKPGILQSIGEQIYDWYKGKNIVIVTDSTVDDLYSERLINELKMYSYKLDKIAIPSGEQSKSLNCLDFIYNKFSEYGITRSSLIIAFGGGVVGDLAGFAAATFMRGIPYIQIPTTVMAQLDSSIGGKTAVNIAAGKNLAGCFYQPKAVYIDTLLLGTLPEKVFTDGMAEAVKYGAIKDAGLFSKLQGLNSLVQARSNIDDIIYKCAEIKSQFVSADEFDRGDRMLLNFGHTIGHAIERYYDYKTYTHGEAVGLGMLMITEHSEKMGLTSAGTYQALRELLIKFKLPVAMDNIDTDKLLNIINLDKKSDEAYINLIVLKEIGFAYIHKVPKDELINFIK